MLVILASRQEDHAGEEGLKSPSWAQSLAPFTAGHPGAVCPEMISCDLMF